MRESRNPKLAALIRRRAMRNHGARTNEVPVRFRTANVDKTAGQKARVRLAAILNTAADAMDTLEKAEAEAITRDTRMARKDLADLIDHVANLTDTLAPHDPKAMNELTAIEKDLQRFPCK